MSPQPLPDSLDPLKLAKAAAVLQGTLPNAAMPRLLTLLASAAGSTEATLRFELDPAGRARVLGQARTAVERVCQRCLEVFEQPLEVEFRLVRVRSEAEAEGLDGEFEPLLSDQPLLSSAQLIEDELILGLPIVALHADRAACRQGDVDAPEEEVSDRKPSPFAVLSGFKRNEN